MGELPIQVLHALWVDRQHNQAVIEQEVILIGRNYVCRSAEFSGWLDISVLTSPARRWPAWTDIPMEEASDVTQMAPRISAFCVSAACGFMGLHTMHAIDHSTRTTSKLPTV